MGVLGIASRALPALYSSVLGLAQAASPDLWWQAGSVCSGAAKAGRGGARIMVRDKWFPLHWLAGTRAMAEHRKNQRGMFHVLGTPKSHALPHAEATSTFIAPCSLVRLPCVDVGWSRVYSLSKASQIYITLFLYQHLGALGSLPGSLPAKEWPIHGQMAWKGPAGLFTTVRAGQILSFRHPSSRNSLPQTEPLQNVYLLTKRPIVPVAILLLHTVFSWWEEQERWNKSQIRICMGPLNQTAQDMA